MKQKNTQNLAVSQNDIQFVETLIETIDRIKKSRETRETEVIENIWTLIEIARHKKAKIEELIKALKISNAGKRLKALLRLEDDLLCV